MAPRSVATITAVAGQAGGQHGLGSAPAALFDAVARLEEELGIGLDPVGPQRAQVGLVAFADVELLEEAGKRDPGVAVGQQVLDGLLHTPPVVGHDHRAREPGFLVAYGHHGLARGGPELLQVVHRDGIGDGHETVDAAPRHPADQLLGACSVVPAARPGRLHGGDAGAEIRCRPDDGGYDGAVVRPGEVRATTPR